jgi:hypothetical protein
MEQQIQQLQDQLSIKEQENQQLVAQLAHLRAWQNQLQQRARANDPHALLVARELYVGGVPEGTTEVRGREGTRAQYGDAVQRRHAVEHIRGLPRLGWAPGCCSRAAMPARAGRRTLLPRRKGVGARLVWRTGLSTLLLLCARRRTSHCSTHHAAHAACPRGHRRTTCAHFSTRS